MERKITTFAALPLLITLAACGPKTLSVNNTLPLSSTRNNPSDIGVVLATAATGEIAASTGRFNRKDNTLTADGLAGSYDASAGTIALSNGSTAEVDLIGDFTGTAMVQGSGGTQFGVFGITASDVPTTDTVTMTGISEVQIIDGTTVYDLSGNSTATVNFAGRSLNVLMDELAGSSTDGVGATTTGLTDVAEVEIDLATITGDAVSGGFFDLRSSIITTVESGSEVVTHDGRFFGPGADELGGVFVVDDTAVGALKVHGVYAAD